MQRKTAETLIDKTRHLVGEIIELQVLDRSDGSYDTRRFRIVANDRVVNLKPPGEPRVCLDVYATAEDTESGERIELSLDKLKKQRC